jgi:hypothetical protein
VNRYVFYLVAIIFGVICAPFFINAEPKESNLVISTSKQDNEFPPAELTSYNMRLFLDINDRILYGNTTIDTKNLSNKNLSELWFTAYPNAFRNVNHSPAPADAYYNGFEEGWLIVDAIKVNGVTVEYQEEDISIKVTLPMGIMPDNNIIIEMAWRAKIPRLAYRYGYKDGVYMLGNFYPTLNVLSRGKWLNSYNTPFGDPFCFNVARYQVNISVPEAYNIVSTGDIINKVAEDNGRTVYWVKADKARDFGLLIAYNYQQICEEIRGRNIKCFIPSNNNDISSMLVKQSGEILDYYSSTIGSYPYNDLKVAIVPMKGFDGMEYTGLIFLRDELLKPDYNEQRRLFLLAHEIAHQWWYAVVGNDQLREPWLDEGLANWSSSKYLKKFFGQYKAEQRYPEQAIQLDKQLGEIRSMGEYYFIAYNGGEAFWFGLEQELGEETVIKILRSYWAENKYGVATSEDLITAIKNETDQDMDYFLNKWL